jgi:hypothetical protein
MLRDPSNKEAFLVPLPKGIDLHNVSNVVQAKTIADIPIVCEFLDIFPDELPGLPID